MDGMLNVIHQLSFKGSGDQNSFWLSQAVICFNGTGFYPVLLLELKHDLYNLLGRNSRILFNAFFPPAEIIINGSRLGLA